MHVQELAALRPYQARRRQRHRHRRRSSRRRASDGDRSARLRLAGDRGARRERRNHDQPRLSPRSRLRTLEHKLRGCGAVIERVSGRVNGTEKLDVLHSRMLRRSRRSISVAQAMRNRAVHRLRARPARTESCERQGLTQNQYLRACPIEKSLAPFGTCSSILLATFRLD